MIELFLALTLLNPARLYFQPQQPIPFTIDYKAMETLHLPERTPDGNLPALMLVLMDEAGKPYGSAILDRKIAKYDLAKVFDNTDKNNLPGQAGGPVDLWNGKTYFAQLYSGARAVGSAMVIVPLYPPSQRDRTTPSALRIYSEKDVELQTSLGSIGIRLDPIAAPNTTRVFSDLVEDGFYTNVIFHRIIANFVIQGGDPTGSGSGGPGFYTDLEPSTKRHERGTVSMARLGNDNNTNGSQFFICLSREGCAPLDGKYTAYGDVIWGMDVVDKMVALPQVAGNANRPVNPPVILKARLVPAMPRELHKTPPATVNPPVPEGEDRL